MIHKQNENAKKKTETIKKEPTKDSGAEVKIHYRGSTAGLCIQKDESANIKIGQ